MKGLQGLGRCAIGYWICLTTLGGSSGLADDRPAPLTLNDLIAAAEKHNPEIRSLAAEVAAARGEVTTTRTWENPELTVAPGVTKAAGSPDQFHGVFELKQPFEFPGKRALRRAVADK